MSFEEEFDKIIKQKADEAGFPFDEKNWEKASSLLDAERKGAGIFARKGAVLAGSLFLIGSTVGLWWYATSQHGESPLADIGSVNEINISTKSSGELIQTDDKPAIGEMSIVSNTTKGSKTKENPLVIDKTSGSNSSAKNTKNISSREFAISAKMTKKESAPVNTPLPSNLEKDFPSEQLGGQEPFNPTEAGTSPPVIPKAEMAMNALQQADAENIKDFEMVTGEVGEMPEVFKSVQIVPLQTKLMIGSEEKNISPAIAFMKNFYDEEYYRQKKNKTHFLNIEAGMSYLLGWQTKNGTDGKGLNWFGGLNYGLYLSKKVTASAGLQLYNVTNIKQAFYTGSKSEFGFGVVNTHTIITAKSLYYFSVPMKLSYVLDSHNQFGLGVNMGFLVNAKNDVQIYSTSENGMAPISNSNKTGIYEGISSTNLLLTASYKTSISSRLALNGEFVYGLTDLFINTKTIKNNETVMGFRLNLQYTIFDK